MDKSKSSSGTVGLGRPMPWGVFPLEAPSGSHREGARASGRGRGKRNHFEICPEHSVLNKACPQEKLYNRSLSCWLLLKANRAGGMGRLSSSLQQPPCSVYQGQSLRSTGEGHGPGTQACLRRRLSHRVVEQAPSPSPHHHILEIYSSSFHPDPDLNNNNNKRMQRQKQFEETAPEPESDMTGMLNCQAGNLKLL